MLAIKRAISTIAYSHCGLLHDRPCVFVNGDMNFGDRSTTNNTGFNLDPKSSTVGADELTIGFDLIILTQLAMCLSPQLNPTPNQPRCGLSRSTMTRRIDDNYPTLSIYLRH